MFEVIFYTSGGVLLERAACCHEAHVSHVGILTETGGKSKTLGCLFLNDEITVVRASQSCNNVPNGLGGVGVFIDERRQIGDQFATAFDVGRRNDRDRRKSRYNLRW